MDHLFEHLKSVEPVLDRFSFMFYLADQSLMLINCTLLLLMLFRSPLREKKQRLWIVPTIIFAAGIATLLSGGLNIILNKIIESLEQTTGTTAAIISLSSYGRITDDIRETFLLVLPFAETMIMFKKPPVRKHLKVVFAYGIIADAPKYLLNGAFQIVEAEKTLELCIDLLLLVAVLTLYIVFQNRNPADTLSYLDAFTFMWVCLTVIFFVLTIVILDVNYGETRHSWIIIVDVLMFTLLIPYIIHSMLKAKQSEAYFRRALDAEIRQFEIINQKDEDLRRFRHDYANHMRAISAMIENERANDVKAYVEKLGVDLQNTTRAFYTGNYMLDIILSEKQSVARQDGNDILFEGSFPKSGISNDDICTIMANALDNAIEACKDMKKSCEINVKSIVKEDQIAVSVTNPVESKAHIIAGSGVTSKPDKTRHGYGLKSIKKTVEKYDGYLHLSSDNQTFELFISLKITC